MTPIFYNLYFTYSSIVLHHSLVIHSVLVKTRCGGQHNISSDISHLLGEFHCLSGAFNIYKYKTIKFLLKQNYTVNSQISPWQRGEGWEGSEKSVFLYQNQLFANS